MTPTAELYAIAKDRMVRILADLDPAGLATTCPACPAWTVRDVVAHHVHVIGALAAGEFPAAAGQALTGHPARRGSAAAERDEWTDRGVAARASHTLDELLTEWDAVVLPTEARPLAIGRLDLTVHLADVMETFGDHRGPDTALVEPTLRQYYDLVAVVRCHEAGSVPVLRCTDTGARLGAGLHAPEISGTAYELLRAIGGRRTRAQADEHLDWGSTSEPVRAAFSAYGWPND